MLGASAVGILALGGIYITRALQPAPISFEGIEVLNPRVTDDELLVVRAVTPRRNVPGCVNGVQIDLRNEMGSILRLPIPAREITRDRSDYSIVIPQGTMPGRYQMKVREVFTCVDGVEAVEAPWVPMEVVSAPAE